MQGVAGFSIEFPLGLRSGRAHADLTARAPGKVPASHIGLPESPPLVCTPLLSLPGMGACG